MDENKILREFQKRVFYKGIFTLIIGLGAIISAFGGICKTKYLLYIGAIIIIVGAVLETKYWRCPVCGKGLPMRENGDKIKHCPSCGARLNN